jgi:hypothetical protein
MGPTPLTFRSSFVSGIGVKVKRRTHSQAFVCLSSIALIVAGCKAGAGAVRELEDINSVPTGRVISGEEALHLYGIDAETVDEPVETSVSHEPWFPMQVWVSASVLPYDDPDPILVVLVYADSELGVQSTWVGDLEAGNSVMLLSIHPDGRACFIKGVSFQGWDVEGWVACNRLIFSEPTPIVNPNE